MRRRTPITPQTPEIPDHLPPPGSGSPEIPDEPLGLPADADEDDPELPGLPEREPPQAD
jgi:hypothetical protein